MEVLGLSLFPPGEKHIVRVRRSSVRDRYHRQLTSVFFLVPVSSMPPAPPTNWNTVTTSKPKPEKPQLRRFTFFQMAHTGNKTGIWQWSVWTTCLKLSLPGWEIFQAKDSTKGGYPAAETKAITICPNHQISISLTHWSNFFVSPSTAIAASLLQIRLKGRQECSGRSSLHGRELKKMTKRKTKRMKTRMMMKRMMTRMRCRRHSSWTGGLTARAKNLW